MYRVRLARELIDRNCLFLGSLRQKYLAGSPIAIVRLSEFSHRESLVGSISLFGNLSCAILVRKTLVGISLAIILSLRQTSSRWGLGQGLELGLGLGLGLGIGPRAGFWF